MTTPNMDVMPVPLPVGPVLQMIDADVERKATTLICHLPMQAPAKLGTVLSNITINTIGRDILVEQLKSDIAGWDTYIHQCEAERVLRDSTAAPSDDHAKALRMIVAVRDFLNDLHVGLTTQVPKAPGLILTRDGRA